MNIIRTNSYGAILTKTEPHSDLHKFYTGNSISKKNIVEKIISIFKKIIKN